MLTNNGSFARFVDYEKIGDGMVPASLCGSLWILLLPAYHGSNLLIRFIEPKAVIIQTPHSPIKNFSCVIRANIFDRSAVCVFVGEYDVEVEKLLERLRARPAILQRNPLSLIGILFEEYGYSCEEYRRALDGDVATMERKTGHTSLSNGLFRTSPNYEKLTRDLNTCKTSLIFLDIVMAFGNDVGTFCKETLDMFETLRQERCLVTLPISDTVSAAQDLGYHLNLGQRRWVQAQALKGRVQTQINLVR